MLNLRNASLFCLIGLVFPALCWAEAVGNVTHLGGILHATQPDGTSRMLSVKSEIMEGDTLKTEKSTYARIKFVDGGDVVLRPETVFKVNAYSYRPVPEQAHPDKFQFDLLKGGVRSVTGQGGKRSPTAFQMNTSSAILGVRGTDFGALLCNNDCGNIPTVSGKPPENGLYTDTAQGTTVVHNAAGSVEVPAGTYSYVAGPNAAPKLVPSSTGVQVTIPPDFTRPKAVPGSNACSVE